MSKNREITITYEDSQEKECTKPALFSLRKRIEKNPERKIQEYFRNSPEMWTHYQWKKKEMLRELGEFAEESKGTPLEKKAQELTQEFQLNFDTTMLKLFRCVGFKDKPKAMKRMMKRNFVPDIKPFWHGIFHNRSGLYMRPSLTGRENGTILIDEEHPGTYGDMKSTVWHEIIHALFENYNERNKELFEGYASFLAHKVTGYGVENSYPEEVKLVHEVLQFDKLSFEEWFLGEINREEFRERVCDKLKTSLGEEEAHVVSGIIAYSGSMLEIKERELREGGEYDPEILKKFEKELLDRMLAGIQKAQK